VDGGNLVLMDQKNINLDRENFRIYITLILNLGKHMILRLLHF